MTGTVARLAKFAHETDIDSLPATAIEACKRRLIDSVACAAAAYQEPFCERIRGFAMRYSAVPAARIWGSGATTSTELAAFANGTMVRYLDYSDTFLGKSAGHPSDMIAGLVAVAEAHGQSGASLTSAIIVAYEVYCGLCDGVALSSVAVDQATCAALGTAAGAGRLLGLSQAQFEHAISLALAPNLHLYNVRSGTLSDWKGCAGPNGTRNGIFAALLAREGVSGPASIVEGAGGLFDIVDPFDWIVDAATPWITSTHLKFHPVCYHGQTAIDAAIELHKRVSIQRIREIHVETYDAAYRAMANDVHRWAPSTRETADHSLPYTIAVALHEGKLVPSAYKTERLAEPRTKQLMDLIRVSSSDAMTGQFPARVPTRISIRAEGGETYCQLQELPRGHAKNPLSDAELESKFIDLYATWGDASAARRTLDTLWQVDRLAAAASLVDALCPCI
ncbi:putative 2-methylcitrate dehydratase [Paraburkholderia unamae]|uniref:MmgE/PrpD family protein n=1 Tax=Paraburkholderia unamae TaxID=219649 RepID=UPI001CAF153D|nr:MmgE/PrpD family protein [Paraburkholderia unamae]CAG9272964.1 putative 2-methylcitrate dehydratase [Paraburkholderia unamae]